MTILHGEYCLSGRVWKRLEDTTRGLTGLNQLVVHEICRVTERDERETSVVEGNDVPPLELTDTRRVDVRLGTKAFPSSLLLTLTRGDAFEPPNTLIDCMVYLDQVQAQAATPEAGLRGFVDEMAELAQQLDARWLHLACEDGEPTLGGTLRLPDVCGIYRPEIVDAIVEPLRSAGAVVDEDLVLGYRVVWVAPLGALLADDGRSKVERVLALIRDRLAIADAVAELAWKETSVSHASRPR